MHHAKVKKKRVRGGINPYAFGEGGYADAFGVFFGEYRPHPTLPSSSQYPERVMTEKENAGAGVSANLAGGSELTSGPPMVWRAC